MKRWFYRWLAWSRVVRHIKFFNFLWMFHFHFECHLDVSKGDLMLLKEFKLREKRGGGIIFVSFRMVCQTLSVKKEFTFLYEFSCIQRKIPELRSFLRT